MQFTSYASGSAANCYKVSDGKTSLLLEAGLPIKELKKRCSYSLSGVEGCLVTHQHADHSKAVADLTRAGVDCFMSAGTAGAIKGNVAKHRINIIKAGKPDIVEFALPRFSDRNLGLLLKIEIDIEYVGKIFRNKSQPKLEYIFWALFQRPSNSTRVFTRVFNTEDLGRREHFQNIIAMHRTSDHDSCWRSDGLREIQKLYFDAADHFEDKYNRKVIPIKDLHFDWKFYLLKGIEYVWVEYQEEYHHDATLYHFKFQKADRQIINT